MIFLHNYIFYGLCLFSFHDVFATNTSSSRFKSAPKKTITLRKRRKPNPQVQINIVHEQQVAALQQEIKKLKEKQRQQNRLFKKKAEEIQTLKKTQEKLTSNLTILEQALCNLCSNVHGHYLLLDKQVHANRLDINNLEEQTFLHIDTCIQSSISQPSMPFSQKADDCDILNEEDIFREEIERLF
ncbi:hypothetical protein KBC04_02285 [Candidatus Babeliales bacterium]|nr:hypothetical protein [Candidatus Babeliales bacterium]MBP9843762.1 hypothetical protein [Candidatus Babeliales bacterium]